MSSVGAWLTVVMNCTGSNDVPDSTTLDTPEVLGTTMFTKTGDEWSQQYSAPLIVNLRPDNRHGNPRRSCS
jgi:hypothetical protein